MIRKAMLVAALAVAGIGPARAEWPTRPITIVVPYAPGGLTDAVARTISEGAARELGQPVVVENKPGAGGKIGMDYLRRAPKDGYTIGLAVPATMVTLPLTDPGYGMEPLKEFAPVTIAVDTFMVLVASKKILPSGGLKEFIALAKSRPGQLNYGTPGAGTSFHFNNVYFANLAGIQTVHVPYKGESGALADLAGGQIDYMLAGQGAKTFVDTGKVRALAVASKKRVEAYPDVPTFKEAGMDFSTDGWVGFIAPAGIPPAVLERLNAALVKTIQSPSVRASFASMGYEPVGSTPAYFRNVVQEASKRYGAMIESGQVKLAQ